MDDQTFLLKRSKGTKIFGEQQVGIPFFIQRHLTRYYIAKNFGNFLVSNSRSPGCYCMKKMRGPGFESNLLKKCYNKVFKLLRIKSSSSHLSRVAPNFFLATRKKSFVTEGLQPQANNISFFLCHKFYTHHPQLSLFNAHFSLSIGSKLGLKRNLERDLHHFQGLFILLALIL